MPPQEIVRALRLITSPEWKRTKRIPITALANLAGLSRETIYQARNGKGLTQRVVETLAPLLRAVLNGDLEMIRGRFLWTVRQAGMEKRWFSSVGPMKVTSASRPARDADR